MKLGEKVINAFHQGKTCKEKHDITENRMYRYRENLIAYIDENQDMWINSCGWMTKTTKSRLVALGVNLQQIKGKWYLKETFEWDGSLINYTKL